MLIIITSRSSSKLGDVGSETRLLGQILENIVSKRHSFDPKFMKLCQIFKIVIISRPGLKLGHVRSKIRLLG